MAGKFVRLSELGETRLLEAVLGVFPAANPEMPGDDCAVVRGRGSRSDLLLKTDSVVEGVHFEAGMPPARAGRKALCRALSDIAAMGGSPSHALLAVFSPRDDELRFWKEFYRGFRGAARRFGVVVSGGEWSAADMRAVAVVATGWAPRGRAVLRSGGRPGDFLYVTGRLGGSRARKHWAFTPRLAEGRWLLREGFPSAMMDISDGLAADLPRLARASGCGFSVDFGRIPRPRGVSLEAALGDGEDYELLMAVPPARAGRLEAGWRRVFPRLPLNKIGVLLPRDRRPTDFPAGGYDHFQPVSNK